MSRKVSIDIVGDSVSAERAFLRTSVAAQKFSVNTKGAERDFSKMTRGIISGSGVFHSLGRSLAFASGGFLAFGTATEAVRKSLDAAEQTKKAFRGLTAQAKASGASVTATFAKVDKLTGPALKLGFNKADVEQGFTTLLRGSGSAAKAFQEMAAAEDVARAKGVSLSAGATIVNRALIGTGNSARALGIHFPKAATAAEKLQIILQKFRGQAVANTTEQDRFNATLFNTEEVVGRTLLPVLNKYLASLGNWLQKMDESGRLQHDVNTVVKDGATILHGIGTVIRTVDRATGSFTDTLKDLAGVWLLLKTRMALINWGVIASGEARVGLAAAGATAEVNGLAGALGRLGRLGPIGVAIALSVVPGHKASKTEQSQKNPVTKALGNLPIVGHVFQQTNRISDAIIDALGLNPGAKGPKSAFTGGQNAFASGGSLNAASILEHSGSTDAKKVGTAIQKAAKHGTSLLGQFNLLELKLADAQRANNTVLQRSILVSEASILVQLRDQAKTLKTRTGFAQQAAGVADQIRALDAAGLSADKKAATAAKKKADAAKKLAQSFTVPLTLQVADARAQALGKSETAILQKIKTAALKALKSGRLGLQGQLDAWNEIASINSQLQTSSTSALNGFKQANIDKIAKSVGLTGALAKKLKAQLSQLGPGGTIPSRGVGAFGHIIGADNRPIIVHTHVKLDGRQVGKSVTRHQQKDRTRNPTQRRGAFAGGL